MEEELQLNDYNKTEYIPMRIDESDTALNNIIIYQTEDGKIQLDVKMEADTVWLTQAQMGDLFQSSKQNISLHINNIFKEQELDKDSVVKEYLTTATDKKKYRTQYYNLDIIISVGYRVKSKRGTQFRIWANKILKDYLIKGYAINQKIKLEQYDELKGMIRILGNTIKNQE